MYRKSTDKFMKPVRPVASRVRHRQPAKLILLYREENVSVDAQFAAALQKENIPTVGRASDAA